MACMNQLFCSRATSASGGRHNFQGWGWLGWIIHAANGLKIGL